MLIATAGHVDHGKTTLVRALTGTETDRLPEEKARGISIDLGFAYWRPDAGPTIGFIDVPGHERYLRNMLAGLSGVACALLVIAADDGIMPQTTEHLRILELLGIETGFVALTRCDRAAPERIAQVAVEVEALIASGPLAGSPILPVSALTGQGMDALSAALIAARNAAPGQAPSGRGFRLAIDRAFSIAGAGTVATGTVLAGEVRIGDELVLLPPGKTARVRGLQSGGRAADSAGPDQRCAINLAGIDLAEVHRGQWLAEPGLALASERIGARIRLLEDCPRPLRHGSGIHLHIGTAAIPARVLVSGQRVVRPGEAALVQLVCDSPVNTVAGERIILRDASGRDLLGGGQVIDPAPSRGRRSPAMRAAIAAAMGQPDPPAAFAALCAIPGHEVDTTAFARAFNLRGETLEATLAGAECVRFGGNGALAISALRFAALGERLSAVLAEYHRTRPEAGGMARREARTALGEAVSPDHFAELLRAGIQSGTIAAEGALVRLAGHSPAFSPAEAALRRAACAIIEGRGPCPIAANQLARELRAPEASVQAMLFRRRESGDAWQITATKYMLREHVAALVATAAHLAAAHAEGFTAAQFRDACGLGRNFVIELLEFFDRIGVTRRLGEARQMRGGFEAVAGSAPPWLTVSPCPAPDAAIAKPQP